MGSTSLDRKNLWNSLKPAVDRQQRKFSKTVSCPTTAVSFPNPNPNSNPDPNLIRKRQETRGEICDSCSCCVGQVAFLDNSLLSVKRRFCVIHVCRSSDASPINKLKTDIAIVLFSRKQTYNTLTQKTEINLILMNDTPTLLASISQANMTIYALIKI